MAKMDGAGRESRTAIVDHQTGREDSSMTHGGTVMAETLG